MKVVKVKVLPPIAKELYPELPDKNLCNGKILLLRNSAWEISDQEIVASLILTVLVRERRWFPVPLQELFETLKDCEKLMAELPLRNLVKALSMMAARGELDLVSYDSLLYIYPTELYLAKIEKTYNIKLLRTDS